MRAGRLAAAALWLACAAAARAEEPASRSDSIHQLEGGWKDSEDRSVTLASLRGKVLVATMAYTTCETVCPMIFADLQRIERALTPTARERVWFVVFSLDPERDTPGRMREFRKERGFESPQWIFLSAPEERVREMSAVLGVQYRRAAEGEVAHTSVLAVVDADGVIRHEQPGVGKDPSPLVVVVEGLVSPGSGETKPGP